MELRLARKHARNILARGGYEVGASHYRQIVGLHVLFLVAVLFEFVQRRPVWNEWMWIPASMFLLLQLVRIWSIRTLGAFWNTRIIVLPGMERIRKGPYRYINHPNYLVVTLEFLFFPLIFGCIAAAMVFPVCNLVVIRRRIAIEEQALSVAETQHSGWRR